MQPKGLAAPKHRQLSGHPATFCLLSIRISFGKGRQRASN